MAYIQINRDNIVINERLISKIVSIVIFIYGFFSSHFGKVPKKMC